MKTKYFLLGTLLILVLSFFSCGTKRCAINQLEKLTHDLYLESYAYTDDEWKDARHRYDEVCYDIEKHQLEMSDQENVYVMKLKGECAAFFGKNKAANWWEELKKNLQDF